MNTNATMPLLLIELRLPAVLLERAAGLPAASRIGAAIDALLSEIGIPAAVNVVLRPAAPDLAMDVFVAGTECAFAVETVARAVCFVRGVPYCEQGDAALSNLSDEELQRVLVLVVAEALRNRADLLFTDEVARHYLETMSAQHEAAALPSVEMLRAALRLGFAIAGRDTIARIAAETQSQEPLDRTEALIAALAPSNIELHINPDYLGEVAACEAASTNFSLLRNGMYYELGIRTPSISLIPDRLLPERSFRFRIGAMGGLPYRGLSASERLINETPHNLKVDARPALNPANGFDAAVVAADQAAELEQSGYTTWDPLGYMILACAGDVFRYAEAFVNSNLVKAELNAIADAYPELVKQVRSRLTPALVSATLRVLLDEEISIRDFPRILQAMLDFDYVIADDSRLIVFGERLASRRPPGNEWENDPVTMASAVRIALRRYVCDKYRRGQPVMSVYLIDGALERRLTDREHPGTLHPAVRTALRRGSQASASPQIQTPLLTHSEARAALRAAIADEFPRVPVLSYQELVPEISLAPIGRLEAP